MSTGPLQTSPGLSAYLCGLVDDAAIFPPGSSPLDTAVRAHGEHRSSWYADLVGPFVISDLRLPDLLEVAEEIDTDPLPVSVVVTGGAGSLEPAVRWATGSGLLRLHGVEIAVRDSETGELAHNAARIVTAVDQLRADGLLADETEVYLEPPRRYDASRLAALDVVADAGLRLKFRTGGVTADAFPDSTELATCIEQALDRETPYKCTAGLHHALRHRDPETGFEHHGFLNVLLATRASLDEGTDAARTALEETDPGVVTAALLAYSVEALASARRWFTSFGSCSVLEPLEELLDLGLAEPAESP
ncbi:MAG: hypothetical protein ACRDPH_06140 [Marmoricola sp.]